MFWGYTIGFGKKQTKIGCFIIINTLLLINEKLLMKILTLDGLLCTAASSWDSITHPKKQSVYSLQ